MEFYEKLTSLLKSARKVQKLDLLKKIEYGKKEETFKKFKDNLIPFLEFKVASEEAKNFRKYWIQYLNKLIESSLGYCSTSEEQKKIKNLIEEINNDNIINHINNKKNNIIEENKIEEEKIENRNKKVENFKLNDKQNNNFNNINFKNIDKFYPKNYKQELNKDKDNNKEKKKEQNLFYNNINNIIDNNKRYKLNQFNYKDNNNIIIGKEKKILKDDEAFEKKEIDRNININITKKKSNEIIFEKKEKIIEEEKFKSKSNENNIIKNNYNNYNNNINQEKNKNNNLIKKEKENKPILSKKEKEINTFCEELLDNNNKNNIIQIIFNYLFNEKSKEDNINNINQKCIEFIKGIRNKGININQNIKDKLITLVCILYPFFSKKNKSKINENIFNPGSSSDKNLYEFLSKSMLIKIPDDFKFTDFTEKKVPNSITNFCTELKINEKNGKYEIYNAFMYLFIFRSLRNYDKKNEYKNLFDILLEKEFIIAFKLRFILEHQEFYFQITDDFLGIYEGLKFIKIFYEQIFSEIQLLYKDITKDNNYIFGKEKYSLNFEHDENNNLDIKALFNQEDLYIYEKVFKKLKHFYNIDKDYTSDIYHLINSSSNKFTNPEINFVLNLVGLEHKKYNYINKDFYNYKKSIISLENDIFNMGKETLNLNENISKISEYYINQEQKEVFYSLLINIRTNISQNYSNKFELCPYGSVTQFLGSKKSDIDIYLYINAKNNDEKSRILIQLFITIEKIIGYRPKFIVSKRLCVITFRYGKNKTEFDISIMGFCPYLHSILFRTYSLIDSRFSLLAITLKKFVEIIKIKSKDNKIEFLNSFSWMILLITFLQDIINPQILPKLLSDKDNSIGLYKIPYGNNSGKNFNYYIDFKNFINNTKEEYTQIPDSFFIKDKSLYNHYKEKIIKSEKKVEKNKLSCAEIFLSFLEFIIYYFKYDSVYVNFSIENEGYEPIKNILNFSEINELNKKDERFCDYFKYKYCRHKNFNENNSKTRDGMILIRDPFDPHYNPAQSLIKSQLNTFIERLKFGYFCLIKHGQFKKLEEEMIKKENLKGDKNFASF